MNLQIFVTNLARKELKTYFESRVVNSKKYQLRFFNNKFTLDDNQHIKDFRGKGTTEFNNEFTQYRLINKLFG